MTVAHVLLLMEKESEDFSVLHTAPVCNTLVGVFLQDEGHGGFTLVAGCSALHLKQHILYFLKGMCGFCKNRGSCISSTRVQYRTEVSALVSKKPPLFTYLCMLYPKPIGALLSVLNHV